MKDGEEHPHHYIPGGYIYSPHNGDTAANGMVYWTHYHAGVWATDHGKIWDEIEWKNGVPAPELGSRVSSLAPTHTVGYYLPADQSGQTTLRKTWATTWQTAGLHA